MTRYFIAPDSEGSENEDDGYGFGEAFWEWAMTEQRAAELRESAHYE